MSKGKRLIILLLCGVLSGCQQSGANKTVVHSEPSPATQEAPQPAPSATPQVDTFEDGLSIAASATTIATSSYSKDDWNLVASQWGQAIAFMKAVPKDSQNYATAQKKLVEYQKKLAYAQRQPTGSQTQVSAPVSQPVKEIAANPIVQGEPEQQSAKRFLEGYFQSVINEGTDGSDQWCSQSSSLQESLFSPRTYQILGIKKYGTANSPSYRFQTTVESSNRGGSPVINNLGFYVMKEENKDKAKSLLNGWCLGFVAHP